MINGLSLGSPAFLKSSLWINYYLTGTNLSRARCRAPIVGRYATLPPTRCSVTGIVSSLVHGYPGTRRLICSSCTTFLSLATKRRSRRNNIYFGRSRGRWLFPTWRSPTFFPFNGFWLVRYSRSAHYENDIVPTFGPMRLTRPASTGRSFLLKNYRL